MENKYQQGWRNAQLDELLISLESGSRPKGGVRGISSGVPSVGGEHLHDNGGFDFSNIKYVPDSFASKMNRGRIIFGDVLIVKDGATTGRTSFVDNEFPFSNAVVNEHVFICRPSKELSAKYLFYYLWSKEGKEKILENFKGSAQGGINTTFSSNLLVPVAPLAEQHRIVSKLDEAFEKLEANQKRLDKIAKLLKRFRQSALTAAVNGKLTEDWRKQNKKVSIYKTQNGIENYDWKNLDFPSTWNWDYIENLGEHILGKMLDAAKNKGEPTLYLRNVSVRWFEFDLETLKEIKATKEDKLKFDLRNGDLFVCEGGEPGRAAVWNGGKNNFIFQKAIHRIRFNKNINPYWVLYNLKVDADGGNLETLFTGTGIKHLTLKSLSKYPVAIPPIEEQDEIVKRLTKLFALAHKMEARYQKAKSMLDKLPQSILAKAFRGELVAQNPNDESAEELLKRIKEEKEKLKNAKGQKQKPSKKRIAIVS